jgi:hypothetical protein
MIGGITTRYPLREWGWGLAEVTGYLAEHGVTIPKRTDCGVCFFQTIGEWFDLWRDHPEAYAEGERWESETGHTFRSPSRDTWSAALSDLRAEFEGGRVPRDRKPDALKLAQCRECRL